MLTYLAQDRQARKSGCTPSCTKLLDEAYTETVKGRIAAIGPRDFTRMGPPIRHATRLLLGCDAKVRLLVVLSDGRRPSVLHHG